jgi:thioredoxin-like negative regulator of GroEL
MPLVEIAPADLPAFLRTHRIAVLLFWAPWSGPDIKQKTILREQTDCASRLLGFGSLNVDGLQEPSFDRLAWDLELITVPITDVFLDGKRVRRLVGVRSSSEITRAVSSVVYEILDTSWLAWRGQAVLNLARRLWKEQRLADLPLLANALEDAGCHDELILEHVRTAAPHANRCLLLEGLLYDGPHFW